MFTCRFFTRRLFTLVCRPVVVGPAPRVWAIAPYQYAIAHTRYCASGPTGGTPPGATRTGQYLLDKNDVLSRVLEIVKNFEKVDASKVTERSHFINDLGLDSLDVVEVVMALEQEFILDIPDHDAEKIQSVTEAVEYISQNPMAK